MGYDSTTRVSEYSNTGFLRDLPQLLQGRSYHGCSYFLTEEGTKVNIDKPSEVSTTSIMFQTFLVTGGYTGNYLIPHLSSTELLVENTSAWVLTGELPSPRQALHGANIDQRVIMTGNKEQELLSENFLIKDV